MTGLVPEHERCPFVLRRAYEPTQGDEEGNDHQEHDRKEHEGPGGSGQARPIRSAATAARLRAEQHPGLAPFTAGEVARQVFGRGAWGGVLQLRHLGVGEAPGARFWAGITQWLDPTRILTADARLAPGFACGEMRFHGFL